MYCIDFNSGRIFCLSEDGDAFVIQASLIIRTISKLYRIRRPI